MIPLKTYSESNTTTMRSSHRRLRTACRTPLISALLTLCFSPKGTKFEALRGELGPYQAPNPACAQPLTTFADPSVYTAVHPSPNMVSSSATTLVLYAPHFASFTCSLST